MSGKVVFVLNLGVQAAARRQEAVLDSTHPSVIQRVSKLHAHVSSIITVPKNLPFCAAEREGSFQCSFCTPIFI